MMEAVTVAKGSDIETGTAVTDVAGLVVVTDEGTTLVSTFEAIDEVVVATDVNEVVDILIDSKKVLDCA